MDVITNLVAKGNSFLWSFLLIVLLCGTGIYYTIRLRFIQVRKFTEGWKLVFGHLSLNGEKHEKGEMTPFQSIATAIAAQVGTRPDFRCPGVSLHLSGQPRLPAGCGPANPACSVWC